MTDTAQNRAVRHYRSRLSQRGLSRFEVLGLDSDRALIRSLARRLAENGPEASQLRAVVSRSATDEQRQTGGIVAALLRSPLVGAELDLSRPFDGERDIDL